MTATVDSLLDEYVRRYGERDMEGVTDLCLWPFLAVRRGEAIHVPDRDAVRDHFASLIEAYRLAAGVEKWTRVEIDPRQLGEHSVFATVHWNALDADGNVVRDTWTSYQLLATSDGWPLPLVHESLLSRAGRPGAHPSRDIPDHWRTARTPGLGADQSRAVRCSQL